jgi:hypothetical protein
LTNLFEVFIFIGWCIVLLYFLVGATYRLSLLGVFTAPLVALLQTMALLSPIDHAVPPMGSGKVNPWLELHASVALIAYAAFALACITGVMFLLQDYLLKKHRIHALFHQLPPIHQLSKRPFLFFQAVKEAAFNNLDFYFRQNRIGQPLVGRSGGFPDLPSLIAKRHPPHIPALNEPHLHPPSSEGSLLVWFPRGREYRHLAWPPQ